MLQTELKGEAGIAALARAIHADTTGPRGLRGLPCPRLAADESADRRRPARPVADSRRGRVRGFRRRALSFFPASRAHETDLVKKLYGDRPIPEGFNLVEEMVRRIRSGEST